MKSPIITRERLDVDVSGEVMSFGLKVGVTGCVLIGTWALCCLLGALASTGPVQMVRGYITAITGF